MTALRLSAELDGKGETMRQEIDDPRKYRVSMSGFSIKTGWGDEKKIVAKYPGKMQPLDKDAYQQWLEDAEQICATHNAVLTPNAKITGGDSRPVD